MRKAYKKERQSKEFRDKWLKEMQEAETRDAFRSTKDEEAKVAAAKRKVELAKLDAALLLEKQKAEEVKSALQEKKREESKFWEEKCDSYGYVFYYNTATGETVWTKPVDMKSPKKPIAKQISDWEEIYDAFSQSVYYSNGKTGETRWERPAEMDISVEVEDEKKEEENCQEKGPQIICCEYVVCL